MDHIPFLGVMVLGAGYATGCPFLELREVTFDADHINGPGWPRSLPSVMGADKDRKVKLNVFNCSEIAMAMCYKWLFH